MSMISRVGLVAMLFALGAAQEFGSPSAEVPLAETFREGLKQQTLRNLEQHGESIVIMAVGESGLGKTSLLSSLFRTELVWPQTGPNGETTTKVVEQTVGFDLEGVPFTTTLIDTPGFGNQVDMRQSFGVITRRVDLHMRRALRQESLIRRPHKGEPQHGPVDVVLYFFAPHRCKGADVALLKLLRGRASIVPILAKADSMTSEELSAFREEVTAALRAAGVEVAHAPIAVITASRPAGREPRGREYPWGVAVSEGDVTSVHSELGALRRFLLIDGLLDLKAASTRHYEAYRSRTLRRARVGLQPLLRVLVPPVQVALLAAAFPAPRRWMRARLGAAGLPAWCAGPLAQCARLLRGLRREPAAGPEAAPPPIDDVPPPPPLRPWSKVRMPLPRPRKAGQAA